MDEIRDALRRLADGNGGVLLPENVVEAARDEASPLHEHFQWDDGEAARQWRLEQARALIRTVRLVYVPAESPGHRIVRHELPEYTPGDEDGYRLTVQVLRGPDRREAVAREHKRCAGHVARYAAYLEESGFRKEAQALLRVMKTVGAAVEAEPAVQAGH